MKTEQSSSQYKNLKNVGIENSFNDQKLEKNQTNSDNLADYLLKILEKKGIAGKILDTDTFSVLIDDREFKFKKYLSFGDEDTGEETDLRYKLVDQTIADVFLGQSLAHDQQRSQALKHLQKIMAEVIEADIIDY